MKRQRTAPKPQRIQFGFRGAPKEKAIEELTIADHEGMLLDQIDRARAEDSCPSTQQIGETMRNEIIERLAKEHVGALQLRKLSEYSSNSRYEKNADRNRRIHDEAASGKSQKAIALAVDLNEATVSRILKKPRP